MQQNLFTTAHACLIERDLESKLTRARALADAWAAGQLAIEPAALADVVESGRPAHPRLVPPRELPRRKLGSVEGRAAMTHAIAHIEFNAINLACDAVYRFRDMPVDYYGDWIQVAAEEAYHFSLLQEHLRELGFQYGDFPAHNGLWDLAMKTADDVLVRMAMVPRVMEARGLDVTPAIRRRFEAAGDDRMVAILDIILRDEIGHVEAGSRWFHYLCEQRGMDAEKTYFELLNDFFREGIPCPLHVQARLDAGFSEHELSRLEALCGKTS